MRTSTEINLISEALAKAQGELKNPEKNQTAKIPTKTGGSYSYNYADLPHTLDTIRGPLAKHGLSHTAGLESHAEGLILCVRLMHVSGQWIESDVGFPSGNDPKTLAANITYFRRYLLTALVGIAADDDLDSEPEAPQATYQSRGKPTQSATSGVSKQPARGESASASAKASEFDSVVSGVQEPKPLNQYVSWPTDKLESYMAEMLEKLKSRNMSASDLKGEPKIKFEQVQHELTRRGNS